MDEILAIIIILMLLYIIDMLKKNICTDKKEDKKFSYMEVLPQYKDKNCEIIVKKPMPSIDVFHGVKGVITEWNEEWVMVYVKNKKVSSYKLFRTENIASIKEIIE